jgi:hypothetical protein
MSSEWMIPRNYFVDLESTDLKQQDFTLEAWSSIKASSKLKSTQCKAQDHTSIHKKNSLNSVAIRGYIRCISATVLQWDA